MSDLPGEMTKHSFSAPPSTSRSIRYSLTARGRSRSPSRRLPTGSSSLEKASGCMRLPCPAAGMIPHMVPHDLNELVGAGLRAVLCQRPFARAAPDLPACIAVQIKGGGDVVWPACDENFAARLEERVQPVPRIG